MSQSSLMAALPDRQRPMRFPQHCVRCNVSLDDWAQFVCDACRKLTIWEFFGIAHGPGRFSKAST